MSIKRATVHRSSNKHGVLFALVAGPSGWEVWKQCQNYCSNAPGGIAKAWRYVKKDLAEPDARALFERRVAGNEKA